MSLLPAWCTARGVQACCRCSVSSKTDSCVCMQATSLVDPRKEKCSTHIPYCCLTECIAPSNGQGSWSYGVLMQSDFLTQKQDAASAEQQRIAWGLDATPA